MLLKRGRPNAQNVLSALFPFREQSLSKAVTGTVLVGNMVYLAARLPAFPVWKASTAMHLPMGAQTAPQVLFLHLNLQGVLFASLASTSKTMEELSATNAFQTHIDSNGTVKCKNGPDG